MLKFSSSSRQGSPRRQSLLVDRCTRKIARAIREGQFQPAQRLSETVVARKIGMSRAPVRAALDRLAALGILERRPRSGTYVRQLTLAEYIEIALLRASLEGLACRIASLEMDMAEADRLADLAHRLDEEVAGPGRGMVLHDLEVAFHGRIAEATRNRTLIETLNTQQFISQYLRQGMELDTPYVCRRYAQQIPTHSDLVASLQMRDPDRAERDMRQHILASIYFFILLHEPESPQLPRLRQHLPIAPDEAAVTASDPAEVRDLDTSDCN